jgi:putative phosphoesterase
VKIGILSDTHLTSVISAERLAERLLNGPFADVEAILHAGDITTPELENCFAPLGWVAVRGNMDHLLMDLPVSRIANFAGKRIGMIHGWGPVGNLEQRVLQYFDNESVDAIVFGHSHQPLCRLVGPVLLFNPGSATDRRSATHHTVGILTLGKNISGEIISID